MTDRTVHADLRIPVPASAAIITRHCRRSPIPSCGSARNAASKRSSGSCPRRGFRLAGSGWYETDFKSDKEAKRNLHEKGDKEEAKEEVKKDSAGAAEGDGKADAKEAAKPDREGRFRKGRFRKERLLRADRKRHAPAHRPVRDGRCEIEIERTYEARAPRARGAPAPALRADL